MKKLLVKICALAILITSICGNAIVCNAANGAWQKNDKGWWWTYPDGSFPSSKWENINGRWYYFNEAGYAVSGWHQEGDEWSYLDPTDCYAYTGWKTIGGNQYYFFPDSCYAARGWQKIDGKWYYFGLTGSNAGRYYSDVKHVGVNYEAGTIKGIDVSVHQGAINWNAVKNEGISYAMVRVGNNRVLDSNFASNMQSANAAGVYTGVYFYSKAMSEAQSLGDAQWVINQLKGYNVNYPVAIDLEDNNQGALGMNSVTQIAKVFCDEIRAAGYTPMVYCNENWAKNKVNFSALPGVARWIARYNSYYDGAYARDIWQSGSTLRLNGISSRYVDVDFARTNFAGIGNRVSPVGWYTPTTGMWVLDGNGYWYSYVNGGYPRDKWEFIRGEYYYFNHSGYIVKGWQQIGGTWYYFDTSGAMHKGWLNYNGNWYYLKPNGAMATGWANDGSHWYYFASSGVMCKGWLASGGTWYYLGSNGAMAVGWVFDGYNWYYMNGSGAMATGWIFDGRNWYYMNSNGVMHTGWLQLGGTWYFMNSNGTMATGWVYIGGNWYYFDGSGAMHVGWLLSGNAWYYMSSSGAMARNTWIGGYWVNGNGVWV